MACRLHINTIALEPNRWNREQDPVFDLQRLLPAVADHGFQFVELWQGHVSGLSDESIGDVKTLADSVGLRLPVIGLYPSLHLQSDAASQELDRVESLIAAAANLGTEVVKLFVGSLPSDTTTGSERAASVRFLRELVRFADRRGMQIAGELHQKTLFDTVESTLAVLRDVPDLQVCYQPFDFTSTARTLADFSALRHHVIHIHVQGRKDGEFSKVENADIDYRLFFDQLRINGYAGDLSIEFVVGCVVERVDPTYLERVLEAATIDATFLRALALESGLDLVG